MYNDNIRYLSIPIERFYCRPILIIIAIATEHSLWPPYVIRIVCIFALWFLLLLLLFFSLPNLSGSRLDDCHTTTHGVALVRI